MDQEIKVRIFTAADALYEQNGRKTYPTVDAVRKSAKANMNDASEAMKEWRRNQISQAAPVAVQVPEAVQRASALAIANLWQQAQEIATEALRAAQAGWDAERLDLDTMRQELADAYEAQARELEQTRTCITNLEEDAVAAADATKKRQQELDAALAEESRRAAIAEQKARDGETIAQDLRMELERAHKEAAILRAERDKAQEKAQEIVALIEPMRVELATVKVKAEAAHSAFQEQRKQASMELNRQADRVIKAQAELDEARKEAAKAREETATLKGRLQALESMTEHKGRQR